MEGFTCTEDSRLRIIPRKNACKLPLNPTLITAWNDNVEVNETNGPLLSLSTINN